MKERICKWLEVSALIALGVMIGCLITAYHFDQLIEQTQDTKINAVSIKLDKLRVDHDWLERESAYQWGVKK